MGLFSWLPCILLADNWHGLSKGLQRFLAYTRYVAATPIYNIDCLDLLSNHVNMRCPLVDLPTYLST